MEVIIILSLVCAAAIGWGVVATMRLRSANAQRDTAQSALTAKDRELAIAQNDSQTASRRADELNQSLTTARSEADAARTREMELRQRLGGLEQRLEAEREERARLDATSEERFKHLANEILLANTRQLGEHNERRMDEILTPLKENIEQFRKAVSDAYATEARERYSLHEKIKELVELNNTIGNEARELSRALRGNSKIQGDWGEMILESILEKSGLRRGQEYEVQLTTDESGRALRDDDGHALRPDVVIRYPDGRSMVIDSKVSLTAYVDLVNCENPAEREDYERRLILSVRNHIKELANKSYQDYVGGEGRADFVMMFIPNEGAYIAAMSVDNNLWQEAYDKRVLIVSPTHLISVVRLVEQLWRNDRVTRNVMAIADEGGAMYDKLCGFVDDMSRIEKGISQTRDAYDSALKKLSTGRGNLLRRAENMRTLGAKAAKRLPNDLIEQ